MAVDWVQGYEFEQEASKIIKLLGHKYFMARILTFSDNIGVIYSCEFVKKEGKMSPTRQKIIAGLR